MDRHRILVTGASGFIGSNLLTRLSLSGHNLMCLTRSNNKESKNDSIQWVTADLSLPSSYQDQVKNFKPNIVIHLSWQDIPDFTLSKSKLNLNQSIDFLSFVLEIDCCKKIIVAGSCAEYNNVNGSCIETDKNTPNSDFVWAKLSLHTWLSMKCLEEDVSLGWMRIFYVFGPGQRLESLIPTIFSNLKRNKLPILKNLNNANDYIYIDDVIDILYLAITYEFSSGIYNIGSGLSTSVLDILRHAESIVLNTDEFSKQSEKIASKGKSNINFWADISKARRELGWTPKTSINSGLVKTWLDFNK